MQRHQYNGVAARRLKQYRYDRAATVEDAHDGSYTFPRVRLATPWPDVVPNRRIRLSRRLQIDPRTNVDKSPIHRLPKRRSSSGQTEAQDRPKVFVSNDAVPKIATLDLLSGVHVGDGGEAPGRGDGDGGRNVPRLSLRPVHSLLLIFILIVALCASLTMLIQQGANLSRGTTNHGSKASRSTSIDAPVHSSRGGDKLREQSRASETTVDGKESVRSQGNSGVQDDARTSDPAQRSNVSGTHVVVNLNTADVRTLQTIKGIGPVTAQRIIDYRSSIGQFTSIDQLLEVDGIGPKKMEKIRGLVTL